MSETETKMTQETTREKQMDVSVEVSMRDGSGVVEYIPVDKHDVASAWLPTRHGKFRMHVFRNLIGEEGDSVVLQYGEIKSEDVPLVRLHSECMTGDVFGSRKCDCGEQLNAALSMIVKEKAGILIYSRQEGRGIGLFNKIRAYELQERGFDTLDANLQLGLPADGRTYEPAAAMLKYLKITKIRLITNNPAKAEALRQLGVNVVSTLNNVIPAHPENLGYLKTKADRMRHNFGTSILPLAFDFDNSPESKSETPTSPMSPNEKSTTTQTDIDSDSAGSGSTKTAPRKSRKRCGDGDGCSAAEWPAQPTKQ